jgi:hypothetical protein
MWIPVPIAVNPIFKHAVGRRPTAHKKITIENDEPNQRMDGWMDRRRNVGLDGNRRADDGLLVIAIIKLSRK